MRPPRHHAVSLAAAGVLALGGAWWRSAWLRDHPLAADSAVRLAPVAARVEGCLRAHRLALSEANAPRLARCVCAGRTGVGHPYCYVGDGFVAFSPEALPHGVFRVEGPPWRAAQGLAYVRAGAPVSIAQEFDRNFGSFGPSSEPRAPGWHLVAFCHGCD